VKSVHTLSRLAISLRLSARIVQCSVEDGRGTGDPWLPSPECHRQARAEVRVEGAKIIAAAVIAAIRLNKENVENSPAVHSKVAESLRLAEMIVAKMKNAS